MIKCKKISKKTYRDSLGQVGFLSLIKALSHQRKYVSNFLQFWPIFRTWWLESQSKRYIQYALSSLKIASQRELQNFKPRFKARSFQHAFQKLDGITIFQKRFWDSNPKRFLFQISSHVERRWPSNINDQTSDPARGAKQNPSPRGERERASS